MKKLNDNFIKLVALLNDGQYHDGDSLGTALNMTRSAVWKAIKKLQAYGIEVSSIKGKGYALPVACELLDLKEIKKKIKPEKIDITLFESIPSTNDYLKSFKNNKQIKICLAEEQTQGKGRLNREWVSPFGKNIYFSCLYPFQKDVSELAGLSLVTGIAIIKALKNIGMTRAVCVKWPNDIMYENKKLAGVLIEIQAESHGVSQAVIGIGMNINMLNMSTPTITQAWTSVAKILGKSLNRNEVCAVLMTHLLHELKRFDHEGFSVYVDEWMQVDCLANRYITLKNNNEKMTGTMVGINEQGHLLLRMENGVVRAFSSGDTSIVKA
ncbi:MAG: biotin--[acetyl-CoA-carboxylase] ligase [Gammaproteobacteria bacterium]|nr:biotin--[acetyl-CoA-carboxylase] ligase [Gammaproteobacteria bacterium]